VDRHAFVSKNSAGTGIETAPELDVQSRTVESVPSHCHKRVLDPAKQVAAV
jgi:hypothetical protein